MQLQSAVRPRKIPGLSAADLGKAIELKADSPRANVSLEARVVSDEFGEFICSL